MWKRVAKNQMKEIITVVLYGYSWNYYNYFYLVTFSSLAERGKLLENVASTEQNCQRRGVVRKLQI